MNSRFYMNRDVLTCPFFSQDGFSALHIAAMTDGKAAIISFLCQNGADANMIGPAEYVPLKTLGSLEIVEEFPKKSKGDGKEEEKESSLQRRLLKLTRAHGEEFGEIEEEDSEIKEKNEVKEEVVNEEGEEHEKSIEEKLRDLSRDQDADEENGDEEKERNKSLLVAGGIRPIHCAAFIGNSENIFALSRHQADMNALSEVNEISEKR
jgi:hypothetical protein